MTTESTPRWTPGSLAEHLAQWHSASEADAVERLTRAARALMDMPTPTPGTDAFAAWVDASIELRATVEAAENWGKR